MIRSPTRVVRHSLADPFEVAESLGGGGPRFGVRHAEAKLSCGAHLQMEIQLILNFLVDLANRTRDRR